MNKNVADRLSRNRIESDLVNRIKGAILGRRWTENYANVTEIEMILRCIWPSDASSMDYVADFLGWSIESLVGEEMGVPEECLTQAFAEGFVFGIYEAFHEYETAITA
jgi:hypothetical protein